MALLTFGARVGAKRPAPGRVEVGRPLVRAIHLRARPADAPAEARPL